MVIRNVCLVGGPPWGLRFASSPNGRIRVTQVLPDGRADQEGVRIGDIVEAINGQQCTGYKMLNAKVRGARGVLRFRFIRIAGGDSKGVDERKDEARKGKKNEKVEINISPEPTLHLESAIFKGSALTEGKQFNKHLPPVPVKPTVQESVLEFKTDGSKSLNYLNLKTEPTNISKNMGTAASVKVDDDLMVPARMCKNYLPPEIFPVHEPDFTHSNRHNGGMRDSIRDKKRFFEMLASQKEFHAPIRMDQLQLHQKIEYESPSLLSSDQDTHISGYESIAGDSVGLTQSTIMTDTGRQSVSRYGPSLGRLASCCSFAPKHPGDIRTPSLVTTATSMAIPATSFGQFLSASLYPPTSAIQRERNLELELVSGNPEGSPVPSIPLDNSFSAVQPMGLKLAKYRSLVPMRSEFAYMCITKVLLMNCREWIFEQKL
uniref:PDZ domain-containing protein n=1 Tax=Setaria digitata TaxID=48799 RepID=A0A915PK28_9BILA